MNLSFQNGAKPAPNNSMQCELKRPLGFESSSNQPSASVVKTSYWPQGFSPLMLDVILLDWFYSRVGIEPLSATSGQVRFLPGPPFSTFFSFFSLKFNAKWYRTG